MKTFIKYELITICESAKGGTNDNSTLYDTFKEAMRFFEGEDPRSTWLSEYHIHRWNTASRETELRVVLVDEDDYDVTPDYWGDETILAYARYDIDSYMAEDDGDYHAAGEPVYLGGGHYYYG